MVAVLDPVVTIVVVGGLAGLEEYSSFRMLSAPEGGVYWLEAVDAPAVAVPCADALEMIPGYAIDIPDEVVAELKLTSPSLVQILLVVQDWQDPERTTLSASGPIVLNTHTGRAVQVVVPGAGRIRLA